LALGFNTRSLASLNILGVTFLAAEEIFCPTPKFTLTYHGIQRNGLEPQDTKNPRLARV
jgi:hypothetical protein